MRPLPFFVGVLVGLATLSWAGAHVRSAEWTRQFTRFHRLISPEANYFPTVRQIKQIIDDGPQDKMFVIVGGTSVFYGVGQPDQTMWTQYLQSALGERFRVINFAQRGGWSNEAGDIAAEILLQCGTRVVYVADGMPQAFVIPYERAIYKHSIVQAWEGGYLIPWKPRDDLLRFRIGLKPDTFRSAQLEMMFDRVLNFNDLWNYFEFQIANLNWTLFLLNHMFAARVSYHDDESMLEAAHPYAGPDDVEAKIAHDWIVLQDDLLWRSIVKPTEDIIPPQLRRITIATIHLSSPRILRLLSAEDRAAFIATSERHAAELKKAGFAGTVISGIDYTETDYVDRIHMSVSGGKKLATMLAPKVVALAKSLGYFQ